MGGLGLDGVDDDNDFDDSSLLGELEILECTSDSGPPGFAEGDDDNDNRGDFLLLT